MRALIAILLLCLSGLSSAAPSCMPALYGTQVGNADYARTDEGWYGYFFCRGSDGRVIPVVFACVHGSCLPISTFADRVTTMKRGENPIETLKAAWDAEFGNTCEAATGTMKTVCDQAYAAARENFPPGEPAEPSAPPADAWEVAPVTSGKRPSRQVVEGALKTMAEPVYAAVGTACNTQPQPTFVTSAGTWMAVTGQAADMRWLCRKK